MIIQLYYSMMVALFFLCFFYGIQENITSSEASPTVWSCYANLNITLFISLEIDPYTVYKTLKNLHLHDQMSG